MEGMRLIASFFAVALASASFAHAQSAAPPAGAPLADHHQHLFSPALQPANPIDAARLIEMLDAAGIRRAVVLSTAYIFEQSGRKVENPADMLRADNDWTSQQVARFPNRLIGFCGINPLKDYALDELARCAKDPNLRNGLKMHFGNSAVEYHNAQHVEQLRRVFRAANGYRMPIVVHMRSSFSLKLPYGSDEARIFLEQIVPAAPDVVIQVAHLAGGGAPGDVAADQALAFLTDAVVKGDPRTRLLYFDVAGLVTAKTTAEEAAVFAANIRRLGPQRILYGSDGAAGGNAQPREAWAAFRTLPLTEAEFRTIANNAPPYMK